MSELLTMRTAFLKHYESEMGKGCRRTMLSAIGTWEKLTDNPSLDTVTNASVATFRNAMMESGLAPATSNTKWGSLRSILRRVGPITAGNPWALELIPRVPAMRPVAVPFSRPRRLSMEELSRLYLAARHMTVPTRNVPHPGYWWQALIVLAYFTGLRVGDLLKARWSDLNEQEATIYAKLNKTGVEADLPLPAIAMAHLARLERTGERIFQIGNRRFYYYVKILKNLAKLKGFHGFHDIRRTAGSEANRICPGMGKVLLLHSPLGVTEKNYVNSLPELRQVVEKMEVPPAFRHGPKMALRMLKQVKQVVDLRPKDFAVPVHPQKELFVFYPDGMLFCGKFYQSSAMRVTLIRTLVEGGGTCTQRTLWNSVFSEPYPQDYLQRAKLSSLAVNCRTFLRKALELPEQFNPIVATTRNDADRGCRYEFFLPPELWQPKTES